MSPCFRPIARSASITRGVAVVALMGATILAGPLGAAQAATAGHMPMQLAQASPSPSQPAPQSQAMPQVQTPQSQAPTQGSAQDQAMPQGQATGSATGQASGTSAESKAAAKAETVEQRITSLHAALQITAKQEPKWDRVAQVMRENAADMEKLVSERQSQPAETQTAVQDLQAYEKFAQAHVTNLRKLSASFDTLYESMPAAQKKVADQVFQNFGHKGASAHS